MDDDKLNVTSGTILPEMFPPLDKGPYHPVITAPHPPTPKPQPVDDGNDSWREWFSHTVWKYAGTLVMERDPSTGLRSVSFLSLSLLLLMTQAQVIWHRGSEIPATMMQILIALLGAKLGHRGVAAYQEYLATKKVNIADDADKPAR